MNPHDNPMPLTPSAQFLPAFVHEVCQQLGNDHHDNIDPTRRDLMVARSEQWPLLRRAYRNLIRRRGLQAVALTSSMFEAAIGLVAPALPQWEWLYARLGDEESRALLLRILAFRALGPRKVKLPLNKPEFWSGFHQIESLPATQHIPAEFMDWELRLLDLRPLGTPISLYTTPMIAYVQFGLQQYRCTVHGREIAAGPGDYVIDGGGCWGDTALYFAHRVGPDGRVFVFEFVPASLQVLTENLRLNSPLDPRIVLVPHPMWSESGVPISYEQNGPGSRVGTNRTNATGTAETLAIDELVRREQLPRIDFIKMDIEGAELPALRGAQQTLRTFRPKVAIAVYHRLEDFFTVPQYLDSLSLGYQFHLRHFTLHAEETILFATVPDNSVKS